MLQHLNVKVPRLGRNRLGVYFVRFPSYRDELGRRRVVQQSLRTKDPFAARLLALRFCLDLASQGAIGVDNKNEPPRTVSPWTVNVDAGEFKADGEDDHQRLMQFLGQHKDLIGTLAKIRGDAVLVRSSGGSDKSSGSESKIGATNLQDAFALHLQVEESSLSEHTIGEKRALFRDFTLVFGPKAGVDTVTAELVAKRWTPIELARPNQKKQGQTLSLARLEKRRGYLQKFFDWAGSTGLYKGDNPVKTKFARKKQIRQQTRSWQEFNSDDIAKIFSPQYVVHMNKPDWYWIPLMGLFSGARLGELCELTLSDFSIVEGIKVFDITEGKTEKSRRIVPIHSRLLELGLWEYIEALKARGAVFLLHHRPPTNLQKSVGREFGILVEKCGIQNERKVFHSFRSTAITDLHNSEAGSAAIRRAVGHASAGTSGVHGDYIRGILLVRLQQAIEKLAFPLVDFGKLRLLDPSFKDFFDAEAVKLDSPNYKVAQEKRRRHDEARRLRLSGQALT